MNEQPSLPQHAPSLAWPALAALSLIVTVYFSQEKPFLSSRPPSVAVTEGARYEARLWQDPMAPEANTRVRDLAEAVKGRTINRVLLVSVPASLREGDREWRCRVRQALQTAASVHHYVPLDATSRFEVKLRRQNRRPRRMRAQGEQPSSYYVDVFFQEKEGTPPRSGASTDNGNAHDTSKALTVAVWYPEVVTAEDARDAQDFPADLSETLGQDDLQCILIGPSSTAEHDRLMEHSISCSVSETLSPWVTAVTSLDDCRPWKPYISTDRKLCSLLADELKLRGISRPNQVLMILERDTAYGREWTRYLDQAWFEGDPVGAADKGPDNSFFTFYYSKGIDGNGRFGGTKTAGAASLSGGDGRPRGSLLNREALEQPSGLAKVDYLRRLRTMLASQGDLSDIRAVGLFGLDIHDKLLILQALRGIFPHAVYFTSDLDALYTHPDWLQHTRNLVVASGHGLIPEGPVPEARAVHSRTLVPPFRDGYQTSAYLAFSDAFRAVDKISYDKAVTEGKLFEIGSRGPVQLYPNKGQLSGWSTWMWSGVALLAALIGAGLVHVSLRGRPSPVPHSPETETSHTWSLLILLVVIVSITAWISMGLSAEPLSWLDGTSVWPTEISRILAMTLSLVFAYHVIRAMKDPCRELIKGGCRPTPLLATFGGAIGDVADAIPERVRDLVPRWSSKRSQNAAGGAGVEDRLDTSDDHVGRTVNRISLAALASASILAGVGAWLLWTFGGTHAPTRGGWITWFDGFLMLASSLAMLWLVFLVVEFAGLHAAWCKQVTDQVEARVDTKTMRDTLDEIARAGGKGIYGPFVVLLILCLGRTRSFDDWTWPIGLQFAVIVAATCVVLAHVFLHGRAMQLKEAGIKAVKARIQNDQERELHEFKLGELVAMRHGILAGPSNHPVLRGLIIPFSGLGGLSLLQWSHLL